MYSQAISIHNSHDFVFFFLKKKEQNRERLEGLDHPELHTLLHDRTDLRTYRSALLSPGTLGPCFDGDGLATRYVCRSVGPGGGVCSSHQN